MAVIDFRITRRQPYAGGQRFGDTGSFEQIDGILTFAVDPAHEPNRAIVDLQRAPRDADGRVRFRADFSLLAPVDPARGSGRLLVELPNRGRRRVVSIFNRGPVESPSADVHPGDGFLFRHGYMVASIGWQWDVYRSEALMGLEAPLALIDGQPIRGTTMVQILPNDRQSTRLLANRLHQPYPVADLDDAAAMLLVRDYEDGEDAVIPRSRWRFARETPEGIVPSREHIYLEGGFEPGRQYSVIYTTEGAPVVGAGLLAVRDVVAFLRHDRSGLNPVRERVQHVYGFGVSQTGRMLRDFLYLGLNVDEEGRAAYDGLLPHVAGARRGQFNHRFAQPSDQATPSFGHLFPFADEVHTDPFTGATEGLLRRLRERNAVPKVIYTNSSAEYWRGDGGLMHIDAAGPVDIAPAPETRIYHFAGTQHGAGTLPQSVESSNDGSRAQYGFNVVDYSPLLRAALVNLDRWVTEGIEPPPSAFPRLADGTAMERGEVLDWFDGLPGMNTPARDRLWVLRTVDLGPAAEEGIARFPIREGEAYPCFVAAVDADGNEVAGLRLPDVTVPVGTHTGWNPRAPETGAPEQVVPMQGFSRFLAATREQREAVGDPRLSLEERYESRESYLQRVRAEAERLVSERYVLAEDVERVVASAAERFEASVGASG
jgi:hypothetical protein